VKRKTFLPAASVRLNRPGTFRHTRDPWRILARWILSRVVPAAEAR
jgi:hypothetical protein